MDPTIEEWRVWCSHLHITWPQILPALSILAIAIAWLVYDFRKAKHIGNTFPPYVLEDPLLQRINEVLNGLSIESRTYVFSAERHIGITIDGRTFSLLFGRIGNVGPGEYGPEWSHQEKFFALAPSVDHQWFLMRADLFTPIFSGSNYSVYRADVGKIIARQNAPSEA